MSLAAGLLVACVACSGDDDSADETTTPALVETSARPATTEPPATTDPPATTEAPTTAAAPSTTEAPTTTALDEEALKAQIAEDYNAAYALREEMYSTPSLDSLTEQLTLVAAPGSASLSGFETFIRDLVSSGERVVANDPDYSSVTAQKVDLSGNAPYTEAFVTSCLVTNERRVDRDGNTVEGGGLGSAQQVELVVLTEAGWLPSEVVTEEVVIPGATECSDA